MTRDQLITLTRTYVADGQIIRAIEALLAFLKDQNSYLESQLLEVKEDYCQLDRKKNNGEEVDYDSQLKEIKAKIRSLIDELPC